MKVAGESEGNAANDSKAKEDYPVPDFPSNEIKDFKNNYEEKNVNYYKVIPRDKWGSSAEFFFSVLGLSVGLGNVWRFPYLAYKDGGGAFLIPYIILLLTLGVTLLFMELSLGQFSSSGSMLVWKCFPPGRGVGISFVFICGFIFLPYSSIMSYIIYYFYFSFFDPLPWSDCFAWWGAKDNCHTSSDTRTMCDMAIDRLIGRYSAPKDLTGNIKWTNASTNDRWTFVPLAAFNKTLKECLEKSQAPEEQFFQFYVLNRTDSIYDTGGLKWDLVLCMLIAYIIIFACLYKGIKSSGKVVFFTASMPYVLLITLCVFATTQHGALNGLKSFFVPEWHKILNIDIWCDAAIQIFYSLSVCSGAVIVFGSYNQFRQNILKFTFIITFLDFFTSVLCGMVNFAILGTLAHEQNTTLERVVNQGLGLAFVTYPQALKKFWFPQFWSVTFFFTLILLGIDSVFGLVEVITTTILDSFPQLRKYKTSVIFSVCFVFFIMNLITATRAGIFYLDLFDKFGVGLSLLAVATFEIIFFMWGYGARNFLFDMTFMLRTNVPLYFPIMLICPLPLFLFCNFVYGIIDLDMNNAIGEKYDTTTLAIGMALCLASVSQPIIWFIYTLCKRGTSSLNPDKDWGPMDDDDRWSWYEAKLKRDK